MLESPVTTVAGLLAARGSAHPDEIAFVEGRSGAELTWGQLWAQARAWQEAASTAAPDSVLAPGRRIGLLISEPLAMVATFVSALAAGITVAPLNPDGAVPERCRQQAALGLAAIVTDDPDADCGALPRWLLTADFGAAGSGAAGSEAAGSEAAGSEAAGSGTVTDRGDGAGTAAEPAGAAIGQPIPPARPADADRPAPPTPAVPTWNAAVILASSGTTGTPKIIPLSEDELLHTARCLVEHHRLGRSDRGYCPLPLFHINALVVGVLSTVVTGGSLVVDRRFSATNFWSVVAERDATWLNLVPAIIGRLSAGDPPPADVSARISFARSASAPLPAVTRERFEERTGIGVLETYGMTEAASQITANPRDEQYRRPGSVGRPVGLDARVTDREGAEVPVGEVGQLQIRGASVVESYWAPCARGSSGGAVTASEIPATHDGWLDTGDLGWVDGDGYFYLVGRVDDVINRGGEKVFPRDVEEVLLRDPDVVAAAVVGRPHPQLGQEPIAFVLTREGTEPALLSSRLAERCERELSRYRRPAEITVTDALPTGPTGKIRHAQLRRELAEREGGGDDGPPKGLRSGAVTRARGEAAQWLELPARTVKPRTSGLTMVIDNGLPTGGFIDAIASNSELIDIVKFGWGTALITADIDRKIAALREHGVEFSFGGTLFEKFASQDRVDDYVRFCRKHDAEVIEVSNGTIAMPDREKAAYVRRLAADFTVVSEVGAKDSERSAQFSSAQWIDAIGEDLEAGALYVITEARESGSSGICDAAGELRFEVIEDILAAGIEPTSLMFEAPTKTLQVWFVDRIGANVNLGNVAPADVIGVETLRLGLRSDTFFSAADYGNSSEAHKSGGPGDPRRGVSVA